jgi:hypothetical protein
LKEGSQRSSQAEEEECSEKEKQDIVSEKLLSSHRSKNK